MTSSNIERDTFRKVVKEHISLGIEDMIIVILEEKQKEADRKVQKVINALRGE